MADESASPESLSSPATLALDTPWKAVNEIERWLIWPLARLRVAAAGIAWGAGWKLYGLPIIQKHRRSTLTIGPGLSLRSTARSNPLGPNRPVILSTRRAGAVLQIGADFGMTGGSIVAEQRITIGDRVFVGANTIITRQRFSPAGPRSASDGHQRRRDGSGGHRRRGFYRNAVLDSQRRDPGRRLRDRRGQCGDEINPGGRCRGGQSRAGYQEQ